MSNTSTGERFTIRRFLLLETQLRSIMTIREQLEVQRPLAMGVDLSKRQARRAADHPPAVGELNQVVLPIKGLLNRSKG
jgi:hypothetical protein